jgi:phosphate/sulfate permease
MFAATWFAIGFFFAALLLARGNQSYKINLQLVSREEFFARTSSLVILLPILAVYMATIAFTLRKHLSSSGVLVLAYFPISCLATVAIFVQVLATPHFVDFIGLILFALVGTPIAYWYLYIRRNVVAYRRNVVAYYQAIAKLSQGPSAVAPS